MKSIFEKLGKFTERHYLLVLLAALLIIGLMIPGLMQIEMKTGLETFVSTESQLYKDFERFNDDFGSDVIMVLVEGQDLDQLMMPANLRAMGRVEAQLGADERVISAQSPALFVRQELDPEAGPPIPPLPDDLTLATVLDIVRDSETGAIREELDRLVPDPQHALISVVLQGNLPPEDQTDLVEITQDAVDMAGFSQVTAVVTGDPAVSAELEGLLMENMGKTLGMAVLLLFVILAVIFKVRGFFAWRWLPLGVVGIGVIYAFGLMGWLNVYLTIMTMSCFPILIGLGIDYGIQFHNRYDEEAAGGRSVRDAIVDSARHIGPAVGIALIAGCLGFAALFFSPIPMIRDFGLILIIGVIASYIVALFPLLAILYWHDRHRNHAPRGKRSKSARKPPSNETGFVERGLERLAPWVLKHPLIIVPIALALTVAGLSVDSRIAVTTDESSMVSQDIPVIESLNKLVDLTGGTMSFNILVEAEDVTRPDMLRWMAQLQDDIMKAHGAQGESTGLVSGTDSIADLVKQENGGELPSDAGAIEEIIGSLPPPQTKNLLSEDRTAANLSVTIPPVEDDEMKDLKKWLQKAIAEPPQDAEAALTGFPAIRVKLVDAVTLGRVQMTLIGIGLIFLGLLVLFRFHPLRAITATLPIVLIIGWAALFMFGLGIDFTPATATFGALIMGIGVEYTILLMTRYYEEREKGEQPYPAMKTAMTKIGRAVSVSGFTTIGGFAALLIAFDFPILVDFGIVTMTNVFLALVASLVVLPAAIVWLDTHLRFPWPRKHAMRFQG